MCCPYCGGAVNHGRYVRPYQHCPACNVYMERLPCKYCGVVVELTLNEEDYIDVEDVRCLECFVKKDIEEYHDARYAAWAAEQGGVTHAH